ncbi:MAG: SPFH domain-containing protein [Candidatus Xenobia bacterium]
MEPIILSMVSAFGHKQHCQDVNGWDTKWAKVEVPFDMAGMLFIILIVIVASGLRVVQQYQRGVVFRLGRVIGLREAGLCWVIPLIDSVRLVNTQIITLPIDRMFPSRMVYLSTMKCGLCG